MTALEKRSKEIHGNPPNMVRLKLDWEKEFRDAVAWGIKEGLLRRSFSMQEPAAKGCPGREATDEGGIYPLSQN
jgi:hypothetical protein